jgi:hypothetical protein
MHCPKCGQRQALDDIRYCSKCGFLLTGIAEVLDNDGLIPGSVSGSVKSSSPRSRGIKQGIFMFLLMFLVVPILTMITIALKAEPIAVIASIFLLGVGGLLRIAYAYLFESTIAGDKTLEERIVDTTRQIVRRPEALKELPAKQTQTAADYTAPSTGKWVDTNELQPVPGSVTDPTTKLLERKEKDQ